MILVQAYPKAQKDFRMAAVEDKKESRLAVDMILIPAGRGPIKGHHQ
jgi:aspartyl/asparaginyl-tRNA synthetase